MSTPNYQGGQGQGLAWYADDFNAPILQSSIYTEYANKVVAGIDLNEVKTALAGMEPSAQAAPLINYLMWVLTIGEAVA